MESAETAELMKGVPVLVLANKQDRKRALPSTSLAEKLGVQPGDGPEAAGAVRVFDCSLVNGTGFVAGFEWLLQRDARD